MMTGLYKVGVESVERIPPRPGHINPMDPCHINAIPAAAK